MCPAPIVLFVYKRLDHTQQTVEALRRNVLAPESDLIVFSDAARDECDADAVRQVREYIRAVEGFRSISITERASNMGLAKSVVAGVTAVCEERGRAIVVEDDIVTSPHFLTYMNGALDFYERYPRVFSISGFSLATSLYGLPSDYPDDTYFTRRCSSWGWATWRDRWQLANWDTDYAAKHLADKAAWDAFCKGGKDLGVMWNSLVDGRIDSWWMHWIFTHYIHGALSVYPVRAYVDNIGHDGSGTHVRNLSTYTRNDLSAAKPSVVFKLPIEEDPEVAANLAAFWTRLYFRTPFRRMLRRIRRAFCPSGGLR